MSSSPVQIEPLSVVDDAAAITRHRRSRRFNGDALTRRLWENLSEADKDKVARRGWEELSEADKDWYRRAAAATDAEPAVVDVFALPYDTSNVVSFCFYTSAAGKNKLAHKVKVPEFFLTDEGRWHLAPPDVPPVRDPLAALQSGKLKIDHSLNYVCLNFLGAFYEYHKLCQSGHAPELSVYVDAVRAQFPPKEPATRISNQVVAYADLLCRSRDEPSIIRVLPPSLFAKASAKLMQSDSLRGQLIDWAFEREVLVRAGIADLVARLDGLKGKPDTTAERDALTKHLSQMKREHLSATALNKRSVDILSNNPFVRHLSAMYLDDGELFYDYIVLVDEEECDEVQPDPCVGDNKKATSRSYATLSLPEINRPIIAAFHARVKNELVDCLAPRGADKVLIVWNNKLPWTVSVSVIDRLGWRQYCDWLDQNIDSDSRPISPPPSNPSSPISDVVSLAENNFAVELERMKELHLQLQKQHEELQKRHEELLQSVPKRVVTRSMARLEIATDSGKDSDSDMDVDKDSKRVKRARIVIGDSDSNESD